MNRAGMSLVELLISLSLACFLIELVIEHYISCKKNYEAIQTRLEQEYEILLMTEFIRDSVRRAGFTPCLTINKLRIHDKRKNGAPLQTSISEVKTGKGFLHINRMHETYASVIKKLNSHQLLVRQFPLIKGPIMIADCYQAAIYENYHLHKTKSGVIVTFDEPIRDDFITPYFVGEWLEEQFYIKKNSQGLLALFYKTLKGDELSSLFHELSSQIKQNVIQVTMKLDETQEITIETRIRHS